VREHRQQKVQVVKEAPAAKAVKSALAVEAVPVAKELLVAKEVRAESWQVLAPAVRIQTPQKLALEWPMGRPVLEQKVSSFSAWAWAVA
jgi:hypothetical protein